MDYTWHTLYSKRLSTPARISKLPRGREIWSQVFSCPVYHEVPNLRAEFQAEGGMWCDDHGPLWQVPTLKSWVSQQREDCCVTIMVKAGEEGREGPVARGNGPGCLPGTPQFLVIHQTSFWHCERQALWLLCICVTNLIPALIPGLCMHFSPCSGQEKEL